jgi:putative SOS response-associated peptidase YedK
MLASMCGRVDIHTPPSQLARLLEVQLAAGVDPDGRPSWNVPPARGIPAITDRHPRTESGEKSSDHERVMDVLRWGLVPHWAKDPRTGYKMINARAETVTKKPAYRSAFANHRCLIVVDGFFEWQVPDPASPKRKVPFYFRRADGMPLTFAGLYETWWDKSRSEEPDPETMLRTCTIITTNAGADMVDVHNRMPVIIERRDFDAWLDPDQHDTEVLAKLLLPAPKGTLVRHPVDKAVNSPRNDGPMIIQQATPDDDE